MADAGGLSLSLSLQAMKTLCRRDGNEVSVVIKRKVSMAMRRAVCRETVGRGGG